MLKKFSNKKLIEKLTVIVREKNQLLRHMEITADFEVFDLNVSFKVM